MPELKVSRTDLIDQIIVLSHASKGQAEAARARFMKLETAQLEELLNGLQGALSRMREAKKSPLRTSAMSDAEARRDSALARIKRVSASIRENREMITPEAAAAIASSTETMVSVLRSSASKEPKPTLAPSLHFWTEIDEATRGHYVPDFERLLAARVAKTMRLMNVTDYAGSVDLEQWITEEPAFDHYMRFVLDKTSKDTMRLMGRHLPSEVSGSRVAKAFWQHDVALRTGAFDPVFIVEAKPTLISTRATEGLAKLLLYATAFNTTRILSVGGPGSVGGFLSAELSLKKSMSHALQTRWRAADVKGFAEQFSENERVVLVADVAPSLNVLEDIRGSLMHYAPTAQLSIVALAGLAETRERLEERGLVYFPYLSTGRDVTLPWHTGGEYKREKNKHRFGHSRPDPFVIMKDFMTSVTSGLRAMMGKAAR